MLRVIAHITPRVFAWARESAGYTVAEVASRLKRDESEVQAWESGRNFPSLRMAKDAAKMFGRPVGVFFLAEPPQEKNLPEFRVLPGASQKQSPQLRRFARHVIHRCEWAESVRAAEGGKPLAIIGKTNLLDDPAEVAKNIRKWLNAPLAETVAQKGIGDALQWWTEKIESAGVFVFTTDSHSSHKVSVDEMRGLAEINPIAPAVAVNAADVVPAARIFTLIHEVAHLWLRRKGITRGDSLEHFIAHRGQPKNADAETEMFCNRVAAETLMPAAEFRDAWNAQTADDLETRVDKIAEHFRVSRTAAARRAADFQMIAWEQYEELHRKYRQEWEEREKAKRKEFGRVKRYKTLLKQNGRSFSRLVLSAYYGGNLHPMKAVALLGAKRHDHIEDMAEEIFS